jgi:malate dehydrogenase (oxaloacetate-decarboxylating)
MLKYITRQDETGKEWLETALTGKALLSTPLLNKGTAFTIEERKTLNLLGKLPYYVETLEEQLLRAKNQFESYNTTLQKYIYLDNLHEKNEILFYKLITENLSQMLPLIYTPGVSDAIKAFSHEFRQPRGLYIAYPDIDHIEEIIENRTHAAIDLIVATDGERVLGIGDQGIGGMDIPIAKLVVYSICGVNPYKTLPIMLDVGTDNPQLLNNPMYLGWRHQRIRGKEYAEFIERFVKAVKQCTSNALLHWEDFAEPNARLLLETYRDTLCSFNDDIQGTAVVTLPAILSAIQESGIPLAQHRIVIFGAGTVGVALSEQLVETFKRQGIASDQARNMFWLVDKQGLVIDDDALCRDVQRPYARKRQECTRWQQGACDLLSVVDEVHPTILIGCSTVKGAFTDAVVKTMAQYTPRPIILPLSNPTDHCEAFPEDLVRWTDGRALIATGSPFPDVPFEGKTIPIAQCNNALAFPGIGLGAIATRATKITDNMLHAAVETLITLAPCKNDVNQPLLPRITQIREVALQVAIAVAREAIKDKVALVEPDLNPDAFQRQQIWEPYYRNIKLKHPT